MDHHLNHLERSGFRSLVGRIGQTPLVELQVALHGRTYTLFLKMEGANPTGSAKDRTAWSLMHEVVAKLNQGEAVTVIASSSGNTAVSLAFMGRAIGPQGGVANVVLVTDPKTPPESIALMQTLGATVDMVSEPDGTGGYLGSRLRRVQQLCDTYPYYRHADQYTSEAAWNIHARTTGPEIMDDMNDKVDAVFGGVSTGGTMGGIARYFAEASPMTRIIAVDMFGSIALPGGYPKARLLTGIGSTRPNQLLPPSLYDDVARVCDEEAVFCCHVVHAATGLQIGGSSGAVLAACLRYLLTHPEIERPVCICHDHGLKYTSTLYNPQWLLEKGLQMTGDKVGWLADARFSLSLLRTPTGALFHLI